MMWSLPYRGSWNQVDLRRYSLLKLGAEMRIDLAALGLSLGMFDSFALF